MTPAEIKPFHTHRELLTRLERRGMLIENDDEALAALRRLSYYRLSGYWYPMRQFDNASNRALDSFRPGASFALTLALHEFDSTLRGITFGVLAPIELAMREMLGHALGRIDPLIHLMPEKLGVRARQPSTRDKKRTNYDLWLRHYEERVRSSREDFVLHHKNQYSGKLPIWVATEVLDWGGLSHLFSLSPDSARDEVAEQCNMTAPQVESWLKVSTSCEISPRMELGCITAPTPSDRKSAKLQNSQSCETGANDSLASSR